MDEMDGKSLMPSTIAFLNSVIDVVVCLGGCVVEIMSESIVVVCFSFYVQRCGKEFPLVKRQITNEVLKI